MHNEMIIPACLLKKKKKTSTEPSNQAEHTMFVVGKYFFYPASNRNSILSKFFNETARTSSIFLQLIHGQVATAAG